MYANAIQAIEIVKDGLVGYWPLDGKTGKNVEDVHGDNEGTIEGNIKVVAGQVGNAMKFNGPDFIDIPGTDSLDFNGKEELTVTVWINPDSDAPVDGVVAGQCCGTIVAQRDVNGWALRFDSRAQGPFEFIVCPGWTGDGAFGAPAIAKGEWHHLAGVVDKNKLLVYLDAELADELAFAGPISTNGTETEIGHAGDGGFIGLIDEVAIYDKALSAKEIKQNFEATGAAVNPKNKLAICWGKVKVSK